MIISGASDDILNGGGGRNVLIGGDGADQFVFNVLKAAGQQDQIKDFVKGVDHIELSGTIFAALTAYGVGALVGKLTYGTKATAHGGPASYL